MSDRIGVAQGGGDDYPFTGPTVLSAGVLDAYLDYDDDACGYAPPFSLNYDGNTVEVWDAGGLFVFLADVAAARATAWGDRRVLEWIDDADVLRLVVRDDRLVPGSGTLDARTYRRRPARLRTLSAGLDRLSGVVELQAGYNVALTASQPTREDGGRFVNRITVDAVPGAGMGRVPGCADATALVRRIAGVSPDRGGNFVVDLDPCFRGRLPLHTPAGGPTADYAEPGLTPEQAGAALKLDGDCHPCYDCSYFVRTYRGVKRVWYRWQALATQAEGERDTLNANLARWEAQRACREANAARLVVNAGYGCKAFVGGSYCNTSGCCLVPLELRFTAQLYQGATPVPWPAQVQVMEAYLAATGPQSEAEYAPMARGPVYSFVADRADPRQTTTARFRLCVACQAGYTLGMTLTVHTPAPTPAPGTGDTCVLPDVTVPDDVAAAWQAAGVAVDGRQVVAVLGRTAPLDPAPKPFECLC